MMKAPTYTAKEVKEFATTITDAAQMRAIAELITEEIDLYEEEEMAMMMQASMMIFIKSMMMASVKLSP